MKRLSKRVRERHKRYLRKLERRLRKVTRRGKLERVLLSQFTILEAPKIFDLFGENSRSNVVRFIRRFRKLILGECEKILFDFRNTTRFVADATLLFTAEVSRAACLYNGRLVYKCLPPKNYKATQVMQQIGLLRLFRTHSRIEPVDDDVIKWRYATGQGAAGEKYDDILGGYEGVIAEALSSKLFTGLTEAMTNVHHHAYIVRRKDQLMYDESYKPWWMFSQERNGRLNVLFCDLGVGIPETIPLTRVELFKKLVTLGLAGSDSSIIEKTIEDSRTRTKKSYRGKGLSQIVETLSAYENSNVLIYSNSGAVRISGSKVQRTDYAESIMGTLIAWSVPLTGGN